MEIYLKVMVIKFFKTAALILLMTILTGCPGESNDCNDLDGGITRVNNLLLLTPLQTTYNQGDIVTLKIEIPSTNTYFGNEVNLFGTTNDYSGLLTLGFNQLFIDNQLTFVKGSQSNHANWFEMPYDPSNTMYEFEVKVKLNRTGQYSFFSDGNVQFQGSDNCNRYRLDTNVLGFDPNFLQDKIEFTVQ